MKKPIIFVIFAAASFFAHSGTNNIDVASARNSADVVRIFSFLPYASPDQDAQTLSEFSFLKRKQIISQLVQSDFIVADTNALMHIADFLSQGQPLPTERRDVEFRNAIKHDRFIQYGNSNHVIRAGGIRYGPKSLAVRQLYAIKDRYNENLSEFRITMFRLMKRELARERWNIYTDDERKALLEEFFCRANATDDEKQKIR